MKLIENGLLLHVKSNCCFVDLKILICVLSKKALHNVFSIWWKKIGYPIEDSTNIWTSWYFFTLLVFMSAKPTINFLVSKMTKISCLIGTIVQFPTLCILISSNFWWFLILRRSSIRCIQNRQYYKYSHN